MLGLGLGLELDIFWEGVWGGGAIRFHITSRIVLSSFAHLTFVPLSQ